MLFFFLFKQKTAYEMRISDWSSDVCSSDLHAIADQPAVGFDLRFAGAAEKAEAAALAFEVGPTPHQPPGLIIEMRQLDLEPPFGGRRALAEDFEDQPGAVDHLGLERGFAVALLDRRQRGLEHAEIGFLPSRGTRRPPHLPPARTR